MNTLASRRAKCLLEVRVQANPSTLPFLRNSHLPVDTLDLLGGLILRVELLKSIGESVGETMLTVKGDGTFHSLVADGVALSEVLGKNAGAGLVFL